MSLSDPELDQLISLVRDSFRVRENHDPTYVDIGGHLSRALAAQQQVIFGRRGSGKSSLLVTCHRRARRENLLSVYVSADEVKKLTYPDVLIRLLLTLFERIKPRAYPWWRLRAGMKPFRHTITGLRAQLDQAERAASVHETRSGGEDGFQARVGNDRAGLVTGTSRSHSELTRSAFSTEKIDYLERHLQDFKMALDGAITASKVKHVVFIVDDFYLIKQPIQPDVIDYLH